MQLGVDADPAPHLNDRPGDIEVAGISAVGRRKFHLERLGAAIARCRQQLAGDLRVIGKLKIRRIGLVPGGDNIEIGTA